MIKLAEIAKITIGEIGNREPVRLARDTPMLAAVETLRDRRRGAAIVEERGEILGIVTERDVMDRIDHSNHSWHTAPVSELMTANPTTIRADQSLREAIDLMIAGHFRHLPIVDGSRALLGILSIRDVLAHIVEHFPEDFLNLPPDPDHEATNPWGG